MKSVSHLLNTYKGILSSPKHYLPFLDYSRSQLFIFFIVSSILLSLLWSAKTIRYQLTDFREYSQQASQEFIDYYSNDLEVSWNGQRLNLDPAQTYSVYYPSFIDEESLNLPYRIADLVPEEVDIDQLNQNHQDALLVISPTQVHIQQSEKNWQATSLAEVLESDSFTITGQSLQQQLENSAINQNQFWQQLQVALVLIAPLLVGLGLAWNFLVLVLLAYLLVIKLYGVKITGNQLVKISLPIVIVASLIQLLAELLYGTITLPLVSIAYWLLLLLVLRRISLRKTIKKSK